MTSWYEAVSHLDDRMLDIGRGLLLVLAGYVIARVAAGAFVRAMDRRLSTHHLVMGRRAIFYFLMLLFVASGLHEMGFKLSVLMGAAGILTVAIGFASQTSASNLISGLFLLGEGSFSLGDIIQVGNTRGEVLSIDLLSIKLRTEDNLFVRIPNETLIKSELINITRFPIRRLDIRVGVSYREDLKKVRTLLFRLSDQLPLCLDEPRPFMTVEQFGASSVDIRFSVWVTRQNFTELKATLQEQVKKVFDEAGIEIPFPQVVVHDQKSGDGSIPSAGR